MPTFRYQLAGGGSASMIDAPDRTSALLELRRRGTMPVKIEVVGDLAVSEDSLDPGETTAMKEVAANKAASVGRALSRSELAAFIRELSTALQAGLPIVQALKTIARQGRNERQKAMLERIIERVEQGKSLADACGSEGGTFSELTVNLMRAGDASGKLDVVLQQAADLLDRDVKLRRSLLSATLYPMILMGLVSISIVIVVTIIVPRVLANVAKTGRTMALPLPTLIVKGFADVVSGYWWVILPGIALCIYALVNTYRQPAARLWIDQRILRVPLLGNMLRDVAVARFTRTLGTLVSAGIPAVSALRVTKGTLGNKAMEGVIDEVCDQVTAGKTIAEPMERSGYFPPMLVQIVNLGERSGRLDQMLNQAAGPFEDKTETSVKLFMTALPPFLVVGMACVVGFIVLAILLPLLEMQDNIR